MTWAKFGTEYFDRLAEVDFPEALEDACVRSAAEAHSYMFSCITPDDVERDSISPSRSDSWVAPRCAQSAKRRPKNSFD